MNIVIINKDTGFTDELVKYMSSNGNMNVIKTFQKYNNCIAFLEENINILDLVILDLEIPDTHSTNIINTVSNNCNIIGLYSSTKTLNEYINIPYIQRLFHVPLPSSTLVNYINIQNGMENIEIIKKRVLNVLINNGFIINHSGTLYLAEVVSLAIKKKMKKLTDIYRIVAVNHNTDSKIIGWSINNAINKVIKDSQIDILCKSFKIDNPKKLTAKYIVNYLINYKNTF